MRMTVNNRFAALLAEQRIKERRNISLQEVAEKTGISRKTLYAWENNTVTRFDLPVIAALCEYFNIDAGELIQFIREEKPESEKPTTSKAHASKKKSA